MKKREKKIAMYKCILHIHMKATDSVDLNFVSFQSDLVVAYERKKKSPEKKLHVQILEQKSVVMIRNFVMVKISKDFISKLCASIDQHDS